jgi:hypothetical protein
MKNKVFKLKNNIDIKYNQFYDKLKNKLPILLTFLVIFILLLFQHNVIAMYFDDYGNASLSYIGETPDIIGTNWTIKQLINWAVKTYNNWGGRILYAMLFLIPMLRHGIKLYMIAQSIVITLIIYYLYKIIKEVTRYDSMIIPAILFILYMLIDMVYLRNGIYWASASCLYTWPLLPLFIFIYLFIKISNKIKNNEKINYYIYLPLLFVTNFFATFSHEQIGVAVLVFILFYSILEHRKQIKKFLLVDLSNFVVSLISYLILFLAPGNWKRMDTNIEFSQMTFVDKIAQNYPETIKNIFSSEMKIFMIILTIIFFACLIKNSNRLNISKKKILLISAFFTLFSALCLFLQRYNDIVVVIYGTIWILFVGILIIIYYYNTKRLGIVSIAVSGCASIFCLIFSPVLGGRTSLPFIFYIFLLIGLFAGDTLKHSKGTFKLCFLICLIPFFISGVKNYCTIYNGYMQNYALEKLNYDILQNYKEEDGNTITLYVYPNVWYGSTRSYQEPSMNYWIKDYFDIPQEVEFEWVDIYEEFR